MAYLKQSQEFVGRQDLDALLMPFGKLWRSTTSRTRSIGSQRREIA
jgi:hypothetical protein